MICPNCGHENAEGAKFCMECGQPLSSPVSQVVPPAAEIPTPTEQPAAVEPPSPVQVFPVPPAPEPKKPFPWGWAALGCGLVGLLVLVLVFTGLVIFKVVPALRTSLNSGGVPSIGSVLPTQLPGIAATPLPPSSTTPSAPTGPLTFTFSAVNNPAVLASQSLLGQMTQTLNLNNDTDFQAPKSYTGKAGITAGSAFTVGNGWCAKDDTTLKENLPKIQYVFTINGKDVDLSKYPVIYFNDDQGHSCAATGISITPSGNSQGTFQVKLTQRFTGQVNDGITPSVYPAGDVSFDFTFQFQATSGPGLNG